VLALFISLVRVTPYRGIFPLADIPHSLYIEVNPAVMNPTLSLKAFVFLLMLYWFTNMLTLGEMNSSIGTGWVLVGATAV
jgi:hypothetical protein